MPRENVDIMWHCGSVLYFVSDEGRCGMVIISVAIILYAHQCGWRFCMRIGNRPRKMSAPNFLLSSSAALALAGARNSRQCRPGRLKYPDISIGMILYSRHCPIRNRPAAGGAEAASNGRRASGVRRAREAEYLKSANAREGRKCDAHAVMAGRCCCSQALR